MTSTSPRVIHFGIDGGSFQVLDPLADRGLMPEYAALRSGAARGVLRSTTPWFTVPAWISWMTGVSAERHGLIYWTAGSARDHWERRRDARRFVSFADVRFPDLFTILSGAGLRVASINMPITFPPPKVNGVVVSGFLGSVDPSRAAFPPGFLSRYPRYEIDRDEAPPDAMGKAGLATSMQSGDQVVEYVRGLVEMGEARHDVVLDLLREDFDLVSVVYVGADRLSHVDWPSVEAIVKGAGSTPSQRAAEEYYVGLDRFLGETRRAAPDALFVVSSDHGQGPPPERVVAPNSWLAGQGFLALRGKATRQAARVLPRSGLRRRAWTLWRRLRGIPPGSQPFVDWERSRAYAVSMPQCALFGVAVPADKEVQQEVAAGLTGIIDPSSGTTPIDKVLMADDICLEEGARSRYPDILVFLQPGYGMVTDVDGPVVRPASPGPGGQHEPEGILLVAGDGVASGLQEEVRIEDVAPTVLTALGISAPDHMDGSPVPWIGLGSNRPLEPAVAPHVPASSTRGERSREGDGLSQEEEELMAEHLKHLGYIE